MSDTFGRVDHGGSTAGMAAMLRFAPTAAAQLHRQRIPVRQPIAGAACFRL